MNREIPDGVVARGDPAEIIREVSQRDRDFWPLGKEYYVELTKEHRGLEMSRIG
jgi:carbonic anhydrase/acetyltransferase-like protein (isoleucine patch superfamily)